MGGEGSYGSNQTPQARRPLPDYINAAVSLRSSLPLKSLTATPLLHRAEERPREGQQLTWVAQQRRDWNPGLLPVVSAVHAACASHSSSSGGSVSTFSLPGLQDILSQVTCSFVSPPVCHKVPVPPRAAEPGREEFGSWPSVTGEVGWDGEKEELEERNSRREGGGEKSEGRGLGADLGSIDSPSRPPPAWAPGAKSELRGSPSP